MAEDVDPNIIFAGFSKLSREERFARLKEIGALTREDIDFLQAGGLKSPDLAEKFIENVLGYFQLPLGIASHLGDHAGEVEKIGVEGLCRMFRDRHSHRHPFAAPAAARLISKPNLG